MSKIDIPAKKAVEKNIKSVFKLLSPASHSYTEIESNLNDLQNKFQEPVNFII
jgi:hypothetical protein